MIPVTVTHRADGRRARRSERLAGHLTGAIDEPAASEIEVSEPVLRIKGWIVSGAGRPTHVATRVGRSEWRRHPVDRDRPDVVESLTGHYTVPSGPCGFTFPLELPAARPGSEVRVEIEVGDDQWVGRHELVVRPRSGSSLPRADYKSVWNAVSGDAASATVSVAGYTDEEELTRTAEVIVTTLDRTVGLTTDDVVLEIGAGVGRIGPKIAPRVKRWIATDVSENMLEHARVRCAAFDNVELVPISGWDLAPIADASIDVVYCTVVFMHLDEWERYSYVCEAMRVLRPGGRLYVDNMNLMSEPGWALFLSLADELHPLERPPNISKSSTPDELRTYLERVGFEGIHVEAPRDSMWVIAFGTKPG